MDIHQQLKAYERYIGYTYSYAPAHFDTLGTRTVTILRVRLNKIGTRIIAECRISYSNGGVSPTTVPIQQLIDAGRIKEITNKIKYRNSKE